MDKNTLSNYGWIVIAVLVLAVMIALATPFGKYIENGVRSTTAGLFDTSEKALNVVGMSAGNGSFDNSKDTENQYFPISWNSMDVTGNVSFEWDGVSWVKIANDVPTNEDIAKTQIRFTVDEENVISNYAGIEQFGDVYYVYYDTMECFIVSASGENAEMETIIPETGFYVLDVGFFGDDIDFVIDYACTHTNTKVQNSKNSTCKEKGYSGDVVCLDCQKLIEQGHDTPIAEHSANANGNCSGCNALMIIPEGAIYTMADGTVLNAGDKFPSTVTTGDKYVYKDYEYRYNQRSTGSGWSTNETQNGWGVGLVNRNQNEYGQILDTIAYQPITSLASTFFNTPVKVVNTTIPSSIKDMNSTFMFCPQLTAVPEIPEGVKDMRNTFAGSAKITSIPKIPSTVENMENAFQNCLALTGIIEINTNTTGFNMSTMKVAYDLCFSGIDFEKQGITLTGDSTVLDSIGATGTNYCSTCNGKCNGGH